eukprot:scaffold1081_cov112-Isochrysis_galbana.AAC.8
MSDADNGQRLCAILARLRAVAASTSAQQGRYPAGELTASTAQLDTLNVSHVVVVAGRVRVQALAQYSRQPANRPEGLAGTVQPPVALEVAARVAPLAPRSDSGLRPGRQPGGIRQGQGQSTATSYMT